ncbi:Bud-site selection protein [Schizophyllum fasciatum]
MGETHGVKRKRGRPQKPVGLAVPSIKRRTRPYSMQETPLEVKIAHKIHHDAKEIVKAAKKAKTFETQKLIKKLKGLRYVSAKKPDGEIQECEAQLEALKSIDYHAVGNTVLHSKIKKDKLLAQHDAVTSALQQELADRLLIPAAAGTPAAKVHARLTSNKALAAEVVAAVQGLRALVQPPAVSEAGAESDDEVEEEDADDGHVPPPVQSTKAKKAQKASASASGSDDEGDGWESGTVDADGAGWESGTVDGGDGAEESDADDSDADDEPPSKKAKAAATAAPAAAGSSQFLPSLSVGFVRGSDDSDIEEIPDKPKKNRRGQRARRAIWEREFGRNANHKKKERDQALEKRRQWEERQQKRAAAAAAREERERAQARVQERPVHPSWEAKKKLKEKEAAAMVPSQGKKLVFT